LSQEVDLLLHNANVVTLDPSQPRDEAVAVRGGRILFVGNRAGASRLGAARQFDCQGLTLLPGFHDAHLHFFSLASSLLEVDLNGVASVAELVSRIKERAGSILPARWVLGQGYHEFDLREKRHPTRWELDKVSPEHPVRLAHLTRHAWVLNSQALALGGITREQEPPGIGHVERDNDGEPTGLILEPKLDHLLPPMSREGLREATKRAVRLLLSSGVTSFQDATASNDLARWRLFRRLKERGQMPCRATVMLGWQALSGAVAQGLDARSGDAGLHLGPIKMMLDETGAGVHPSQEELDRIVLGVHRAGFQVAIHAIEERAVAAAIGALEKAQAACPRTDARHRLEHASQCPPALQERLRRLGAVVASQPPFLYASGDRYRATVAPEKQRWLYPFGSWHEAGVPVAGSSDAPVATLNPLLGIYAAATRRSRRGTVFNQEEALSVHQSLQMYTLGAAYSVFREGELGSIAAGKLADFILVDRDPTHVPVEELKDIRVVKTFIGGDVAWEG